MLKSEIEALLFSSGRKMSIEELSKLSHKKPEEVQNALVELKKEYDDKATSVMLVNEGDSWKLTVREQFLSLVQKIVTETELSKTVTETLAVIAFKYPIKQSDLIKIRTNKAYGHLKELEEMGYISRQKHGRTNLIKLTQKFFEYFNLPEEKLKEQFSDFGSIAKAIEDKENEIDAIKKEQKEKAEEEKKKAESIGKEVDLLDEEGHEVPLETYEEVLQDNSKTPKEKIGGLEVVDEPSEEELEAERERIQRIKEEENKKLEGEKKKKKQPAQKQEIEEEIKYDEEIEKIVDEKVERILHPDKENEGIGPEDNKSAESNNAEEKDILDAEMEENKEQEKNNS